MYEFHSVLTKNSWFYISKITWALLISIPGYRYQSCGMDALVATLSAFFFVEGRANKSFWGLDDYLLVFIRYWFVSPGWSTSWMEEAKMAAIISSGVNTFWKKAATTIQSKNHAKLLKIGCIITKKQGNTQCCQIDLITFNCGFRQEVWQIQTFNVNFVLLKFELKLETLKEPLLLNIVLMLESASFILFLVRSYL